MGCYQQGMSLSIPRSVTAATMTVDQGRDPDPQRHLQLGQDLLPDVEASRLSWQEGDGRKEGEGSGELHDTPCWGPAVGLASPLFLDISQSSSQTVFQ